MAPPAGKYRWIVMWLLFAAMVINYVDRQMIGFLKPTLSAEFGWSETDYADIVFWFQASYAVFYLIFGRIMDRVGARWGLGVAFLIWQIGHMMHGAARDLSHFIMARMLLGVGEAGGFPGGIKAVAEWFPKKERAFATGLFNAGTNIGAIVTPLVVPILVLSFGWQMAFVVTGLLGLIWLPIWLIVYRRPREVKNLTQGELEWIEQDPADTVEKIGWKKLLTVKETWAYAAGKFLIDPIWWMFLFWLPDFLGKNYGLDLKTFGPPIVAIYLLSDVGSVGGGWMSGRFMKSGMSLNKARKLTMLICALCAVPVAFAAFASNLWVAVLIIGLATAAHQGFSANLYAFPGDVFPRSAVGSVVGIGGMLGGIGGMIMAKYAGFVLDQIGTYTPIFVVAASAYLVALLVVHLISPRYEPAKV
ncbi:MULTISPECIES: MFS transporter [unclassified Brevundimonas]|uniref:MFS transporter n=1 Tax=unclassified Brevundimonas TaxID=2622653 RepID=UPI0025BB8350|nr:MULTISPECIES: MFS transporter [unclassified Brevundimonas]